MPEVAAPSGPTLARPALDLRVLRRPGAPVIALRFLLPGGARREEIPGLAYLTGRMLCEGSEARPWRRLADDLESRGMILSGSGGFESHGLALDALAEDWDDALEILAEILRQPAFDEERCAWLRRQIAVDLEAQKDQPEILAAWAFAAQLYAPHPRSRPVQGTPESLARLDGEACRRFHREALTRPLVLTVSGEFDADAVEARARELFAGLGGPAVPSVAVPPPGTDGAPRQTVELPEGEQAHLYAGHLTVDRNHEDFDALRVLAVILGAGAGLSGRIPTRIREREGLAYTASAQTLTGAGRDPGCLTLYAATSPDTLDQAEASLLDELERLVRDGIEEAEMQEARSYLLGSEPFRRETAHQWANLLAEAAFFDRPVEDTEQARRRLERVDRQAVERAIRRHVRPGDLRITRAVPA